MNMVAPIARACAVFDALSEERLYYELQDWEKQITTAEAQIRGLGSLNSALTDATGKYLNDMSGFDTAYQEQQDDWETLCAASSDESTIAAYDPDCTNYAEFSIKMSKKMAAAAKAARDKDADAVIDESVIDALTNKLNDSDLTPLTVAQIQGELKSYDNVKQGRAKKMERMARQLESMRREQETMTATADLNNQIVGFAITPIVNSDLFSEDGLAGVLKRGMVANGITGY